jgi:hypothetical protein
MSIFSRFFGRSNTAIPKDPQAPIKSLMAKAPKATGQMGENARMKRELLGSFKKGGHVKKTGIYKLHKGEEVVPAKKKEMAEKMKRYQVLSPDGITVEHDKSSYGSLREAKKAAHRFAKNYKAQGYYSQTCYNGYNRHIPVDQIPDYCDIKEE